MTNREKYADQILDIACNGDMFAVNVKTQKPVNCAGIHCKDCKFNVDVMMCGALRKAWCDAEYIEPSIDWSKVPVDTPILVRDSKEDKWLHRHFAKFEDEFVYAWDDGQTSWSSLASVDWKYAKLAEDVNNEKD